MATYILKAFDVNLVATGFRCVMLSGSFAVGDRIDTESKTGSVENTIKGDGIPVVDGSKISSLTLDGSTYRFGSDGMCITNGFSNYRLMLAAVDEESSEVGALNKICNILNEINNTLEAYTSKVNKRLSDLEDSVEDIEGSISDLDERVTALEEEEK